jgi:tRNA pseudouridine38-40 synthase
VRYFISLAYKGTHFHGWQVQPNAVSVQEKINEGLSMLLKEDVMILGAGRTDAGVHAKQMYAHFDTDNEFDCEKIAYRLNSYIDDAILIKSIFSVSDTTHARFHATARTYEYWLCQEKNPFLKDGAWMMYSNLDFGLMNEAAAYLTEVKDFTSFAKIHSDVKTHICDVRKAIWEQKGDVWVFTIEADRFLRNMVRAIVGTLVDVGKGKMTLQEFKNVITKMDRGSAGVSAPAPGLYLVKVEYPQELLNGN